MSATVIVGNIWIGRCSVADRTKYASWSWLCLDMSIDKTFTQSYYKHFILNCWGVVVLYSIYIIMSKIVNLYVFVIFTSFFIFM